MDGLRSPVLMFDAAGLGLFAVAGTQKALALGVALPTIATPSQMSARFERY
jgi:uncharacterized membrane protein YeiH